MYIDTLHKEDIKLYAYCCLHLPGTVETFVPQSPAGPSASSSGTDFVVVHHYLMMLTVCLKANILIDFDTARFVDNDFD